MEDGKKKRKGKKKVFVDSISDLKCSMPMSVDSLDNLVGTQCPPCRPRFRKREKKRIKNETKNAKFLNKSLIMNA